MNKILWTGGALVVALAVTQGCIIKNESTTGGTGAGSPTSTGTEQSSSTYSSSYSSSGTVNPSTGSTVPTSCDATAGDDQCTSCEKSSCCAELTACDGDANCGALYGQWYDCLYPSGPTGDSSGYTSNYCEAAVQANNTAAGALIECLATKCNAQSACGDDVVTWDNFAAQFTEDFCAGCHFPSFFAPDGKTVPTDIPQFTDDANWSYWPCPDADPANCATQTGPEFNPDWKTPGMGISYDETVQVMASASLPANIKNPDKIWCGVSTQLPSECASEFPGHFPNAERFPPKGTDPNKAQCSWTADGSCPQPSDAQRNRMASWIFDGMAK